MTDCEERSNSFFDEIDEREIVNEFSNSIKKNFNHETKIEVKNSLRSVHNILLHQFKYHRFHLTIIFAYVGPNYKLYDHQVLYDFSNFIYRLLLFMETYFSI